MVRAASDRVVPGADVRPATPATYWVWLGGATLSLLGTHVLGFAMAWVAAGRGGSPGLVLTMINLPRTVLLLVGGAVGDRSGAWRTMIVGDAVMTAVTGWRPWRPGWWASLSGCFSAPRW